MRQQNLTKKPFEMSNTTPFAKLVLSLTLSLVSSGAVGADRCQEAFFPEFLFGPEFTVTRQEIVDEGNRNPRNFTFKGNPLKEEAWKRFRRMVTAKCRASGDCRVSITQDKHGLAVTVTFANGFYFTFGRDVAVLEANARPGTKSQFAEEAQRLDEYFFKVAREASLEPHERAGNGHIHLSRKAFGESGLHLRNFFVDFQNRPELVFGALGNHLLNGPPLAALKPGQRTELERVLLEFDSRLDRSLTIKEFVTAIHDRVYTETYYPEAGSSEYYQAFNMTRLLKDLEHATLEIRSFRPQENMAVFLLQLRLLDAWVRRLSTVKEPLPYVRKDRHEFTLQEIVDAYQQLLSQLDLPWQEFRALLPKGLREIRPTSGYRSVPYEL